MDKHQNGRKHSGIQIKESVDQDQPLKQSLEKITNKLIVMSGKGGVGKTSVSVNLALALAGKGFTVGLMDVDIHGPDVPRMLGLKENLDLSDNKKLKPLSYSKSLKVVSLESLTLNRDDAIIWRGPIKHSAIRQFISDVEWGHLDYLIIDSPPGTGDEPLTIAQTVPDARAILVTTPQEISLADVRKSISFCNTVNMELFGLIENMSGFTCPKCGETLNLFGFGGGEKTAKAAGVRFLGRIPFDPDVVSCADAGASLIDTHADAPVTKAFEDIAEKTADLFQNTLKSNNL
jgi:Mrp family chromosome partitioning ATPase